LTSGNTGGERTADAVSTKAGDSDGLLHSSITASLSLGKRNRKPAGAGAGAGDSLYEQQEQSQSRYIGKLLAEAEARRSEQCRIREARGISPIEDWVLNVTSAGLKAAAAVRAAASPPDASTREGKGKGDGVGGEGEGQGGGRGEHRSENGGAGSARTADGGAPEVLTWLSTVGTERFAALGSVTAARRIASAEGTEHMSE